jgi:hypothetical protein
MICLPTHSGLREPFSFHLGDDETSKREKNIDVRESSEKQAITNSPTKKQIKKLQRHQTPPLKWE